ncbi:MAG TPA: tetratricopeptide repeat protein [Allosphingosinicella sp.]|nr:tetratricopeptide repeat protein [Allosphingosinicella sp.]
MRVHLIGLILLASTAVPALVQAQSRGDTIERRVDRVEQQLRAVQRRVFPNGAPVEPEIGGQPAVTEPGGAPGGDAVTSLTQRVDALETQLRALTGQIEENGYRTRQLDEAVTRLRAELGARLDRVEQGAAPPQAEPRPRPPADEPAEEPAEPPPSRSTRPAPDAPAVPTSAEEAYNAGYRLWDQRRFGDAQAALEAAATRYPTGRWISWTRNLLGRAYLDDGKPATAARVLLANYQENPRGDRAADSLFYLGQALTQLNRRTEACRVYDELARVYPDARAQLRDQIPQARRAARCAAN